MTAWALEHLWGFGWRLCVTVAGCVTIYNVTDGRLPFDVLCIGAVCVILVTRIWARWEGLP